MVHLMHALLAMDAMYHEAYRQREEFKAAMDKVHQQMAKGGLPAGVRPLGAP